MAKKPSRTILRPYKTYLFRDKDPVIDVMRTMVQDSGESYRDINIKSNVSISTMRNWFHGATRRPQFATAQAVARSLGHSFELTKRKG